MTTAIIGKPIYNGVFSGIHIPLEFKENMTLREAFKHQIQTTRLLVEDDFIEYDDIRPVVWNGVIFRPDGNFYSNGREMKVGDKLVIGYISESTAMPTPVLIEESDIESYEDKLEVIRVSDNVPVFKRTPKYMMHRLNQLCYLNKSDSEEAESIREQLDFIVKEMSEEEYNELRNYSVKVSAEFELTKCLKENIDAEIDSEVINCLKNKGDE